MRYEILVLHLKSIHFAFKKILVSRPPTILSRLKIFSRFFERKLTFLHLSNLNRKKERKIWDKQLLNSLTSPLRSSPNVQMLAGATARLVESTQQLCNTDANLFFVFNPIFEEFGHFVKKQFLPWASFGFHPPLSIRSYTVYKKEITHSSVVLQYCSFRSV